MNAQSSVIYKFDNKNVSIEQYVESRRTLIESALPLTLRPVCDGAGQLFAAMEYSLLAGGKRLRPLLFLAALESMACNTACDDKKGWLDIKKYLPFACGIEMIHTYSLIHDDLPAMDDDDMRRGRPSCHKAFDEATAILAGDGLLTHSFAVMLGIAAEAELLVPAVKLVAEKAGIGGMVAGQVIDVETEGQALSLRELQYIHSCKTGALLQASVVSGAWLSGVDAAARNALMVYAGKFGLAFQIVDDILDVVADEESLGKPVGSDAANNKTTYVTLLGLNGAKEAAVIALAEAKVALEPLGEKGRLLGLLADYYLGRQIEKF